MKACVVISEPNIDKAIELIHKYELCEIRLDLCLFTDEEIKKIFSQGRDLIATYHPNNFDISTRINSLKLAIKSGATYVDIDYFLDSKYIEELIEFAKKNNCKSIISYHNFEETPSLEILNEIINLSKNIGTNYVKIATKSVTRDNNFSILSLYNLHKNLIAFCMGNSAEARITRIKSIQLGAPFTYVYDGNDKNKVADGQLSLKEFSRLIQNINH